ncbi:MAG: hypothetical protein K2V38_25490 [Gemmataceae bacterium]|nr:hypothetical protein [Gemmataceae bacterium]
MGRLLAGEIASFFQSPQPYDESISTEHYRQQAAADLEIVVPPGQTQRREATWDGLLNALSCGKYRGVVLIGAYGYHNDELGEQVSYRDHPIYQRLTNPTLARFLDEFTKHRRNEELAVARELIPRINPPAGGKFWLLTLVTKQDLWWTDRSEVKAFYTGGEYAAEVGKLLARLRTARARVEVVLASLVVSNFVTGRGELLKNTAAGYDQTEHATALNGLVAALDGLRRWEDEQ